MARPAGREGRERQGAMKLLNVREQVQDRVWLRAWCQSWTWIESWAGLLVCNRILEQLQLRIRERIRNRVWLCLRDRLRKGD